MRITSKYGIILMGVLVVISAVCTSGEEYFVSDSLRGTFHPHYPSRVVFHSGEHNRTYVAYMDNSFDARVICYDHDTKQWSESFFVDDCRTADGHNTPVLLITADGFLHLFYGCHSDPIRYARSVAPEDPSQWELRGEIGCQETYPNPVQLANGDILVFARHSFRTRHGYTSDERTEGRNYLTLIVFRSTDGGETWDDGTELLDLGELRRVYIRDVIHDPETGLVHIAVLNNHDKIAEMNWNAFYLKYDPASGHLIGLNGADMGPYANLEILTANGCRLLGEEGAKPDIQMTIHEGVPYLCFTGENSKYFASVRDGVLVKNMISTDIKGFKLYTADGVTFEIYGTAYQGADAEFGGRDVVVWTSTDAGQTWDEGRVIVDRHVLGEGARNCNLTINYSGSGPFLVFQTYGGKGTPFEGLPFVPIRSDSPVVTWEGNKYDLPERKSKRLYALDRQYNFVTDRIAEAGH